METTFQKKGQKTNTSIAQKKQDSFFGKMAIQKKLTIGASNDAYETEADRVADQVVGMSDAQVQTKPQTGALIQRKCATCGQEEKVQMKSLGDTITPLVQKSSMTSGNESTASDSVTNQINSSKGGGKSMGASTKNYMESRFGTDFSGVKIHTDSNAIQLSRELNAQAFTVGNNIYFNEGKYNPNSTQGKHLLAHELTHTVQQGGIKRKIQKSCHDGKCKSCGGGIKDFWVTFYFRIRATRSLMSKIRTIINEAKTILANCCLNLKADFNWSMVGGDTDVNPFTFNADGTWNYTNTVTDPGTGNTFNGAKGVPILVVDNVQHSGGGVTIGSSFDSTYTGTEYFILGLNQINSNPGCNHLAHELWHVGSDIIGHDAANGTLAACTGNGVSAAYCSGLRAMV